MIAITMTTKTAAHVVTEIAIVVATATAIAKIAANQQFQKMMY
jgi:hypothetical protein